MIRETHQKGVTTLWRLAWDGNELACVVYRESSGLRLAVESSSATSSATILSEPFDLQPRALARTEALRSSLLRRGWRELPLVTP